MQYQTKTRPVAISGVQCSIIGLVVLLIFLEAVTFDFINFDDNLYVTENNFVRSGLTWEGIRWAFTSEHGAHWHPLAFISHMIDVELFGLDPKWHHFTNIIFHSINATLVYILFVGLTGWTRESAFIALIFGLHPMRIESVVWISERKDVLSVFFILLSLIAYLRYVKETSLKFYLVALGTFVLALLSKPSAVVVPALMLLIDWIPLSRFKLRGIFPPLRYLWEKVPFILGAAGCALATLWAQGSGGGLKSWSTYPAADRFVNVLVGYLTYCGKLFFPSGVTIFYPFQLYQPGIASGALVGLMAISYLIWCTREKFPELFMGWLWFLVTLLPVIGIIQIGGQSYADRWSYFPHLGLLFGIVSLWRKGLKRRLPIWMRNIVVSLPLLGCVYLTTTELPHWKSSESLFRRAVTISPNNFMAHTNLGHALDSRGNHEEARLHFERAATLAPTYPVALANLAGARLRQGNYEEAITLYQRALSINPSDRGYLSNLGMIYSMRGEPYGELFYYLKAFELNRQDPVIKDRVERAIANIGLNCTGFKKDTYSQLLHLIEKFLESWPKPKDNALRLGLEGILSCS